MSTGSAGFQVEEVTEVASPSRARVDDALLPVTGLATDAPAAEGAGEKLARKKDYLEGFLNQRPQDVPAHQPGGALHDAVVNALKEIYDPEIPVNIYDLGLIYGVDVGAEGDVIITMTLTTPHCPVAESMPAEVEMRASSVPGVRDAQVNLVWDPAWDSSKMSDEARLELGML